MKRHRSICVIGVIITLFGFSLLCSGHPDGVESDDYGKVIGQIVDPETGEPVKEPFYIYIYDSDINSKYPDNLYQWGDETDDRGKFELELVPYTFYLQFNPVSSTSKYSQTKNPFCVEEKDRDVIKIEAGKITYFKKKAALGGVLKIYTADMNNIRFNPQEKFNQKFTIRSKISKIGEGICQWVDNGRDTLGDGELLVYRLFDGNYRIYIEFEGLGFTNSIKDNILVEPGKITEVIINLDLTDITGIEGFITDANGAPVENSYILFSAIDELPGYTIGFTAISNKDGYYRLTGMPEGNYHLTFNYDTKDGRTIVKIYGYLYIKKNVLLHLDFKFEKTIAEMEKK
jgi:hypothetical protein